MNPAWRLAVSTAPLMAAIVFGWHFLIEGLGQGSLYVTKGWYASLLGMVVLVMGLAPVLAGLAAAWVTALALRQPGPAAAPGRHVDLLGALLYTGAALGAGAWMWRLAAPRTGEYTEYGTAFGWIVGLVGVSVLPAAGVLASRLVTRRLPPW